MALQSKQCSHSSLRIYSWSNHRPEQSDLCFNQFYFVSVCFSQTLRWRLVDAPLWYCLLLWPNFFAQFWAKKTNCTEWALSRFKWFFYKALLSFAMYTRLAFLVQLWHIPSINAIRSLPLRPPSIFRLTQNCQARLPKASLCSSCLLNTIVGWINLADR